MPNRISVYWCPGHNRPPDMEYMRRLGPAVIRILEPDVQQICDAHQAAPHAIIMPRLWWLDDNNGEQKKAAERQPLETGKQHAHQWAAQLKAWQQQAQERGLAWPKSVIVSGVNEPNEGVSVNSQVKYTVAFLDECKALGLRAAGLCLGVGWPANTGPDTPVNWEPYRPALEAIKRGGHVLDLHEYWYDEPENGWTWLAGRHLQLPAEWDIPILIGECGVDRYVDAERWQHEGGNRGWQGNMEPDAYAADLVRFAGRSDARVMAVLPFCTDYRQNGWESFDTARAHGAILDLVHSMPVDPPKPPPVVPPKPDPKPVPAGAIDPNVALAIFDVESGGSGFGDDGRMTIRFEAHIFQDQLGDDALFAQHFQIAESKPWVAQQWLKMPGGVLQPIHTGGQATEWQAFAMARSVDPEAAMKSISMGLAQIMGFNHARVGYSDVAAMFADYGESVTAQIVGFFNYVLTDAALFDAIRAKDWREIARLYNGSGSVDVYAPRLEAAYLRRVNG